MFTIGLKGAHIDITPAIRTYAEEKIKTLERFVDSANEDVFVEAELGTTTHHHQQGNIFRAEITLRTPHISVRAEAEKEDLYVAIDAAKDELIEELKKNKARHQTLIRKGGRMFKDIVRKMGFGE